MGTPSRARGERYPATRDEAMPAFLDRAGRVSRPSHRLAPSPQTLGRRRFRRRRRRRPSVHLLLRRRAGRLPPCHCRGTMRHVHVACLDAGATRARAQRVVPRVRPVRLPPPHRARRVGVVPRRSQDGRWPRVDRRRRRGDARRTLSRAVSARARAARRRVARALRRAHRYAADSKRPRSAPSRARALAAPRPSHDWRGAVAIDAARAQPSRARSRAARAIHLPAPSVAFYRLVGWADRGRPGGTPRAPAMAHQSRDVRRRARCLVAGAVIVARRGAFGNYVESFAPTRGRAFPVSALIASRGVGAGRLSRRRRRDRVRLRASAPRRMRAGARGRRRVSMYTWGCRRGWRDAVEDGGCRAHLDCRVRVVRL